MKGKFSGLAVAVKFAGADVDEQCADADQVALDGGVSEARAEEPRNEVADEPRRAWGVEVGHVDERRADAEQEKTKTTLARAVGALGGFFVP